MLIDLEFFSVLDSDPRLTNFHGSMHYVSIFVSKTRLLQFLGIYCILFSSSGAQLCTGVKVQYTCACNLSFGVELELDPERQYMYCNFPPVYICS